MAEIVQRQGREHHTRPRGLDRQPAKVAHIGIERLGAGNGEEHAAADRYRSPGGAIYGTSSNGRRAAFLRPGNRGRHRGLYLVGGSSHPGGGLPLVAMSARIVADLVREDGW